MDFGSPVSANNSIIWQIPDQITPDSEKGMGSMFEPQTEMTEPLEKTGLILKSTIPAELGGQEAPEKKLTLLALRLALFEKTASGLGALGFIWATVVLLGGFAVTLEMIDFGFVTIILLVEGGRIYSRSHELEWQHEDRWSLADGGKRSFQAIKSGSKRLLRKALRGSVSSILPSSRRQPKITTSTRKTMPEDQHPSNPKRTWSTSEVRLIPYAGWISASRNMSRILHWFQLAAATACVVLSMMRLLSQEFGVITPDIQSRNPALEIFYGLALSEACVFLIEKSYWEWKVRISKYLEHVNKECGFGETGIAWIRRFFYDAYTKSLNGSIFDGLKMDLLSFAAELLLSHSFEEQLTGSRMLAHFTTSERFSADAFRRIGTSMDVMERLVEMLSWRSHREEEIRKLAAMTVSKITGKKQNSLRVAGIPGAMESISSLLHTGAVNLSEDGIQQKGEVVDEPNYEYSAFNLLGLLILKKLANEHDNCGKIGTTRGLLSKIIDFTGIGETLLIDSRAVDSQITIVKRSLKLVKKLTTTTGGTGEVLRQEISSIVFTISNLRDIIQYGELHIELQSLAIDILTSMALDEGAREKIGSTGGILNLLFGIFFKEEIVESDKIIRRLRMKAGEALAMLALDNQHNCERMLKLDVIRKLVESLDQRALCINAARILRNLSAYTRPDCPYKLVEVTEAAAFVFRTIMSSGTKSQEVAIGLAAQIFRFTNPSQFNKALSQAGTTKSELASKLVQTLQNHPRPSVNLPRIRRFVVELVITMMRTETSTRQIFKELQVEKELRRVAETTSELECYNVFSGTVGLSRHATSLPSLLDVAQELLHSVSAL